MKSEFCLRDVSLHALEVGDSRKESILHPQLGQFSPKRNSSVILNLGRVTCRFASRPCASACAKALAESFFSTSGNPSFFLGKIDHHRDFIVLVHELGQLEVGVFHVKALECVVHHRHLDSGTAGDGEVSGLVAPWGTARTTSALK